LLGPESGSRRVVAFRKLCYVTVVAPMIAEARLGTTIVRADRGLSDAKRRGGDTTIQVQPYELDG
jgi:hypothetical protein